MGVTVTVYWPGITEEQFESQPHLGSRAWGEWMAEREGEPPVTDAFRKLRADAIVTYKTDGMDDDDVSWVSPQQLRDAATRLRDAVRAGAPETAVIVATYDRHADADADAAAAEQFIADLDELIAVTTWAEAQGATRMTLDVNW